MLRVVLVEDEIIIRETLRDTVPWGDCGYALVGEAGDGEMALPLIRETRPDVLITDIQMPFMDGLALSKLALQELPHIKIIILSGHGDFEYARQAIDVGVERYLLKPVTKSTLMDVLTEVRNKIEEERRQQNYLAQFHREAQEYEDYTRRRFFEQILAGQLSVQQIYETADKLDVDLRAQSYTVAFFSAPPEESSLAGPYSECVSRIQDELMSHFLKYPEYWLLRWNLTTYAVLIKGDARQMEEYTQRCIDAVRRCYEGCDHTSWHVAVGRPTPRLSTLPQCYEEVSRLWAYHLILPQQHILTADTVEFLTGTGGNAGLDELDVSKVDPKILRNVMENAEEQELPGFVDAFIRNVAVALESKPFCQYLMLSVRFAATGFAAELGISQQEFLEGLTCLELVGQSVTASDLKRYILELFSRVVKLRSRSTVSQGHNLLKRAVAYIDAHFTDDELSLNRVAREINLSANYLSAIFSQEMGMTFTEYLTGKRMERARELLRTTDQRSGEIAFAVGYRDPHYFSFLFKKTQGCTPRDYRAGVKKQ